MGTRTGTYRRKGERLTGTRERNLWGRGKYTYEGKERDSQEQGTETYEDEGNILTEKSKRYLQGRGKETYRDKERNLRG